MDEIKLKMAIINKRTQVTFCLCQCCYKNNQIVEKKKTFIDAT